MLLELAMVVAGQTADYHDSFTRAEVKCDHVALQPKLEPSQRRHTK
jgi:hypothetical protein